MPDGRRQEPLLVGGVEAPRHVVGVVASARTPAPPSHWYGVWFVPLRVLNAP